MPVIAVAIQKGGVGKTTLTLNLAAILAKKQKKPVICLDLDPQGTATNYWLDELVDDQDTTLAIFDGHAPQGRLVDGVTFIPASIRLAMKEVQGDVARLSAWAKSQKDSIVLIDCPPNLGRLTTAALLAAQHCIIPVTPEPAAVEAIDLFAKTLASAQKQNSALNLLGIIVNALDDRTRVHQFYVEQLQQTFGPKILGLIHRSVVFPELQHEGKTVTALNEGDRARKEYATIARNIIKQLGVR
ncbi:ParA family protein [Jonquetella anthropi]|uniref:ParA family protein n=1 Tax=Jonquetella anthropi TaxID=428712 RepID=UPI0023EFB590|nr:ParA family protein [Jonquetella anthropi]